MKRRYRALRVIATIYKLLGLLVAIIALLVAVFFVALPYLSNVVVNQYAINPNTLQPFSGVPGAVGSGFVGVMSLLYGLLIALFLYGFGEGIYVMLALEENTRLTTVLLQNLHLAAPVAAPTVVNPPAAAVEPAPAEPAAEPEASAAEGSS